MDEFFSQASSEDSGLVADAFDVLPDEHTLAIDPDIDFCFETANSFIEESFSDLSIDLSDSEDVIKEEKNQEHEEAESSAKLKAFTREQARQWRRKRILNSQTKPDTSNTDKCGMLPKLKPKTKLEPLFPLPEDLKPMKNNPKNINSTLGGEKKCHRGPMPMKLRPLPESFWKEPQSLNTSTLAGSNYAVLPPLFSSDAHNADVTKIRPVTPPEEKGKSPAHSPRHKKKWIIKEEQNAEASMSRLFEHLAENKIEEKIIRRGRPKKSHADRPPPPPPRDENNDPCIVDNLADKLFPELSLSQRTKDKIGCSSYAIVKIGKGSNTLEFPAIKAEENYPEILNALATHL